MNKKIIFCLLIIWTSCNIANMNVNRDNYNKIQNGMTSAKIIEILGEPNSKIENDAEGLGKSEVWHYQLGMTVIMININNGRVVGKNWME